MFRNTPSKKFKARSGPRGKTRLMALSIAIVVGLMTTGVAATSATADSHGGGQEVCPGLDTGHKDPGDGKKSVVIDANPGYVIVETCVKAGSDQSVDGGAVNHQTGLSLTSVTLWGPGGKDISHYSYKQEKVVEEEFEYSSQKTVTKTICTSSGTDNAATATGKEFSDTKTGSDFTDEEKAAIDALAQASADEAFDAKYMPYEDGECQFTYSAQRTVTKTICLVPGLRQIDDATARGALIEETKTGSDFTDEEKADIDGLAQASAEEAFDSEYQPYVDGECPPEVHVYRVRKSVEKTICMPEGTVVDARARGARVWIVSEAPITQEQKEAADAEAEESANAAFNAKYPGWTEGQCVYTYAKQATVTQDICTAGGTIQGATATGAMIEETKLDLPFTQEEKDAVDERAAADARAAFEEAFAPYTPGECSTTNSYSFSRQATVTRTICTVDGTIDGAQATGSLIAETRATPFSDAEKADIEARAQASAEAAFAAAYPGHVEGACTTTTEEPEETPVAVAPILPGTVEETPDAVAPVLPAKVPAGEESSGTNLAVALPLGVLGMLGMVIAGLAMRRGSRGSITSS